jgi:hypothetical protein
LAILYPKDSNVPEFDNCTYHNGAKASSLAFPMVPSRKGWKGFSPKDRSEAEPHTAQPRKGCATTNALVDVTTNIY